MNVKPGDTATVIKGTDGINVGKIVNVLDYRGEHSKLGPVWRIASRGSALVTEYGGIGPECDCPDAWLRPLVGEPNAQSANDEYAPVDAIAA